MAQATETPAPPELSDYLNGLLERAYDTCPPLKCIPHASELRKIAGGRSQLGTEIGLRTLQAITTSMLAGRTVAFIEVPQTAEGRKVATSIKNALMLHNIQVGWNETPGSTAMVQEEADKNERPALVWIDWGADEDRRAAMFEALTAKEQ